MGTWLNKLLEKIVMKFHIGDKTNIDVKFRIASHAMFRSEHFMAFLLLYPSLFLFLLFFSAR